MDIKRLNDISVFSTLNEQELEQVANITREKRFRNGEVIMKEGDEGDTMYLILEGVVEVSKVLTMKFGEDDYRETDKVLTRFKPEDYVVLGEMALITQETRSATILAVGDCVLVEINRNDFLRIVESSPRIGAKVLYKISELLIARLRQVSQDVIRLTTALSIALSR
jgi:CRP-like cAMP-binding protein